MKGTSSSKLVLPVGLLLVLAVLLALFVLTTGYYERQASRQAESRSSLFLSTLTNALERYQHLPFILSEDPEIRAAFGTGDRAAMNFRLSRFAEEADVDALYLLALDGKTIAASNYDQSGSFLNQNYGFRPYFKDAVAGRRGQFYGIGATTSRPGFFIAEPVRDVFGDMLGVIALKLDLSALEESWKTSGETVLVSNPDGIVVLSSRPEWRYSALRPVSAKRRAEIAEERQFGKEPLKPLDWRIESGDMVSVGAIRYLHLTQQIATRDWTFHFLTPERPVTLRAILTLVAGLAIFMVVLSVGLFLRAMRVRAALAASQAARRSLQAANVELAREIEERRQAESKLTQARSELARSSKLATLGQLSASVTHELGQPIAAMKNYLAAAEMGPGIADSAVLRRLSEIVVRMEGITSQLRFFARPEVDAIAPFDLVDAWIAAKDITLIDLASTGISLSEELPDEDLTILGNRGRLEQVIVNLLRNAILAMSDSNQKVLSVRLLEADGKACFWVADTGCGLGDSNLEMLQEPFVTTRPSGEGMGLGLAISSEIIREHEGELVARNRPGGGAEFGVILPLSPDTESKESAAA